MHFLKAHQFLFLTCFLWIMLLLPLQIAAQNVEIPDTNLRVAIEKALGKDSSVIQAIIETEEGEEVEVPPITIEEMETLTRLHAVRAAIQDLTGLEFAINLVELNFTDNIVTDLSPLKGLTRLERLILANNVITDLSPLSGLTRLNLLSVRHNPISDISPLSGLISLEEFDADNTELSDISTLSELLKLRRINLSNNPELDFTSVASLKRLRYLTVVNSGIIDLSPIKELQNLVHLNCDKNVISDISPIKDLIRLTVLKLTNNAISDIIPLEGLTNLEVLELGNNLIADLSPLVDLLNLKHINLDGNLITDVSPLAGLINLTSLSIDRNKITDVSPLAGLINLSRLELSDNNISDVSPLAGLIKLSTLNLDNNPVSDFSPLVTLVHIPRYRGGPKIVGPWLWVLVPGPQLGGTDLLAEASGGTVTEVDIATQGAKTGKTVGNNVWTASKIEPELVDNIGIMLNDLGISRDARNKHVVYGSIILSCDTLQETSMFIGSDDAVKVWLNGELINEHLTYRRSGNYQEEVSVTLQQGTNVLLVAIDNHAGGAWSGYFGFAPDAEYEVLPPDPETVLSLGAGSAYSAGAVRVSVGDTFTLHLNAEDVVDLAGWQFDIAFNPDILETVEVKEGDFFKTEGANTFFKAGTIDNAEGTITGISAALIGNGVSGTGTLLSITFMAKSTGETLLKLSTIELGSTSAQVIPSGAPRIIIVVSDIPAWDVNEDGKISILDLILVANDLGSEEPANPRSDVNGDGSVSILDLILVAQNIGKSTDSTAPSVLTIDSSELTPNLIKGWITQAKKEHDGSIIFHQGIANLQNLLASLIPDKTTLLANYPNPFNPETWIPYQLATPASVSISIYSAGGTLVRTLVLGNKTAGLYQNRSRAAYWDGRNELGESVASGVYLYTLSAGEFTATRKMLVLK